MCAKAAVVQLYTWEQGSLNQGTRCPEKQRLNCVLESQWINSLNISFQGDAVTLKLM